jgi:hypothetical protein
MSGQETELHEAQRNVIREVEAFEPGGDAEEKFIEGQGFGSWLRVALPDTELHYEISMAVSSGRSQG